MNPVNPERKKTIRWSVDTNDRSGTYIDAAKILSSLGPIVFRNFIVFRKLMINPGRLEDFSGDSIRSSGCQCGQCRHVRQERYGRGECLEPEIIPPVANESDVLKAIARLDILCSNNLNGSRDREALAEVLLLAQTIAASGKQSHRFFGVRMMELASASLTVITPSEYRHTKTTFKVSHDNHQVDSKM